MANKRTSGRRSTKRVSKTRFSWLWILVGIGVSWLSIIEPVGKDLMAGFLGWGGFLLGPFIFCTGVMRLTLANQREATTWRNRFIFAVPLVSVMASAPTLGPDGSSSGGGLIGDLLPAALSSVIGQFGFWLCSVSALFAIYWVLGRPIIRGDIMDRVGVSEIFEDAFGDIEEGAEPRVEESRQRAGQSVDELAADDTAAQKPERRVKGTRDVDRNHEGKAREVLQEDEESPSAQNNKPLVRPRPIAGAILNEEETYEPLADPEPDLPLSLDILGETQPEQSPQRFDPEVLAEITAAIQQTVRRISKIELVPLGDPIVGMSAILLNFEPKDHFKSLKSLTELTKDLSVATNREKVRIDISTGVRVELSLTNEEREYVPILPLLEEVAEVDVEAAPQYLIGRTQDRTPYQLDVDSALHLLVGGSTGGGKSVLLHSIIWGLIYRYPPSRVRLVLYDRKGEEFAHYKSLPHLWQPIITNEGGFHRMLENVTTELNRRIEVRKADPYASFTWLIVIMDEFRGLTNDAFVEFTSMARSYQIRVILGTQRADKESISTRVKQNLGTNIALKVRDHRESQLIIGNSAAEDLLMWGDCLVHSAKGLERIQVGNVTKDDLMLLREALR